MNKALLKKIMVIMLLGAALCLIESYFYEISNFTIYHHLANGLICVLIATLLSKTKDGYFFGFHSKKIQRN